MTSAAEHPIPDIPATTAISSIDSEGISLHVKTWDIPFRAKILFNHGFCDSAENFDDVFPEIAVRGYEVICFDQRGAGKTSPGKLFAITNERLVYVDLDKVIETVTKDYDGKLFLAGHSMEKTRPGIILRTGVKFLAKYLPKVRSKTGLNLDYITTDQERIKFLKANPKRIEATGPQMAAMLDRGEKLVEVDFVEKFVDKPVACFHGTGDLINAFRGTAQFFDLLKVSDKKLYSYPEYYHDLFHETRERVEHLLNDTFEWLDAHTSTGNVEETQKESAKVVEAAEKVQHEGPPEAEPITQAQPTTEAEPTTMSA
ncbi:hypothetical protein DV495_002560 [Geotrichum candidum]|nr:hypothetical protein DV453_003273 [Geotrichum candidum]KAF5116631.1 hypothetical protein DV452_002584 [Geotrichum candidum]KAF5129135.1 hypothetical protein DV495_002560 [Geotrichum candidum]